MKAERPQRLAGERSTLQLVYSRARALTNLTHMLSGSGVRCPLKSTTVDVSHSTHYTEKKSGVEFTLETKIITKKWQVIY